MFNQPNIVYYLILLLPCTVCLFGATFLIFQKENNTRSYKILTIGFLLSALLFLCTANHITGFLDRRTFMWWDIIDSFATMFAIPTMFLYFRSMINEGRFTWKEYIGFVPALVVGVGTTVLYMLMDKRAMEGYIQSVLIERNDDSHYSDTIYQLHRFIGYRIYHFTTLFQIVWLSVFSILGVRKYHRRLRDFYSDADDKSIHTDYRILCWFLLIIPLALALIIPNIKFWGQHPILASLLFLACAVLYFALFYYGSKKRHTVDNFVQDLQQADLDEKSYCGVEVAELEGLAEIDLDRRDLSLRPISPELYQRLVTLFAELIDDNRIYLKSDLRLDEVARLMFTNRVYVSRVIKERYQCSFSDCINRKRIDFSMDLMRQEPNLTQDVIAEKSGFINAQSYSRTFKKMVGIPPKEWQNLNLHHH